MCGRRELVVLKVKIACMSTIQLLKLRKWVVVSHYFVPVMMCGQRIHWYDRTCLRWVDLVNLVPKYVFNLQFNILKKTEDICKTA